MQELARIDLRHEPHSLEQVLLIFGEIEGAKRVKKEYFQQDSAEKRVEKQGVNFREISSTSPPPWHKKNFETVGWILRSKKKF